MQTKMTHEKLPYSGRAAVPPELAPDDPKRLELELHSLVLRLGTVESQALLDGIRQRAARMDVG
jgi:hypothetical protein